MDIDDLFQDSSVPDPSVQILSRLDAEEETVYVLAGRERAGLKLTVCAGTEAWVTLLTTASLCSMAASVGMETEEFTQETERALMGQPLSTENFVFNVSREAEGLRMIWKRHLLADNVKFQLGSVVLRQEQASPVLKSVLDHAVSSSQSLKDRITQLERENLRLAHERKTALERLEQYSHIKEQLEEELYSKFKLVLNEKKSKIRRLMQEVQSQCNSMPPPTKKGEDTGHMGDTEQHKSDDTPSPQKLHSPSPSSALLGEPLEVISPPVKRRKREARHRAKGPDIPRPPTITRPPSTEKVKLHSEVSHSSSAEGDDLLQLL